MRHHNLGGKARMRKTLVSLGVLIGALTLVPGSQAVINGLAPVAPERGQVHFPDGTRCYLKAVVTKAAAQATATGRYDCYNGRRAISPRLDVRIKTLAGIHLGHQGRIKSTVCARGARACAADSATAAVPANARASGTAIFEIIYPRNAAFFLPPPYCEYVRDVRGLGPPGWRLDCVVQDRTE